MTKFTKTLLLASVCSALMLSQAAFAKGGPGGGGTATPPAQNGGGGGGNGGGGGGAVTAAQPVLLQSTTYSVTPAGQTVAPVLGSDQTIFVKMLVQSDGTDVPLVVQTSGLTFNPAQVSPAVPNPVDAKGVQGVSTAIFSYTPTRADIGTDITVSFTATTASGKTISQTFPLGIVQDVPPGILSGFSATRVGDNYDVKWNPPADGSKVSYQMAACATFSNAVETNDTECIVYPMPGVASIASPDGTLTEVTIPAVSPVGFFQPAQATPFEIFSLRAGTATGTQSAAIVLTPLTSNPF